MAEKRISIDYGSISGGGTDVSDTTALVEDVLEGKVFHLANGESAVGTHKDKNTVEIKHFEDTSTNATSTYTAEEEGLYIAICELAASNVTFSVTTDGTVIKQTEVIIADSNVNSRFQIVCVQLNIGQTISFTHGGANSFVVIKTNAQTITNIVVNAHIENKESSTTMTEEGIIYGLCRSSVATEKVNVTPNRIIEGYTLYGTNATPYTNIFVGYNEGSTTIKCKSTVSWGRAYTAKIIF